MKKLFVLILFLISSVVFSQENLIYSYVKFLSSLDKTKYYSVSIGIIKYEELFTDSSQKLKDQGFEMFNLFYNEVYHEINYSSIDYDVYFDNNPQNEILVKHQKNLKDNGFIIVMDEMPYLERDYNYVFEKFSSFVSIEMQTYILLLNSYLVEGTVIDGALAISPTKLAERLVKLNYFIQTHPNFILIDDCKIYERYLFTLLIKGTDNTPLLNDDKTIRQNYLNAYEFVFSTYPNTIVHIHLKPYYNLLKLKDEEKINNLLEIFKLGGVID